MVTLHVEQFTSRSLEHLTGDGRVSPDDVLRAALLYYLEDRDAERPAWRAPRFRPQPRRGTELSVSFDDETWAALESEARRQRVTSDELAAHALLYYMADIESGRAGERLQEAFDE
jgi:hypothetical protein